MDSTTYEIFKVLKDMASELKRIRKLMSDERCPVGGVDREGVVDKISIENAVETPFWMAVWATEPERMIDVRMSYSDLKVICDLIDAEREKVESKQ